MLATGVEIIGATPPQPTKTSADAVTKNVVFKIFICFV
jgi:hypothetical protein